MSVIMLIIIMLCCAYGKLKQYKNVKLIDKIQVYFIATIPGFISHFILVVFVYSIVGMMTGIVYIERFSKPVESETLYWIGIFSQTGGISAIIIILASMLFSYKFMDMLLNKYKKVRKR